MSETIELMWEFKVELEGDEAYVIETPYGDRGSIKWGPMHPGLTGTFIHDRNEMLRKLGLRVFEEVKRRLALETQKEPPPPEGSGG